MLSTENNKPKLIYIGDPMCSWCYGISEELTKTADHYKETLETELIVGGLRPGGGEKWDAKFKDFLKHHWEDVGMRSGQPFKFDLLEWESFDYDTEPSCRAVVAVLDIDKSKALSFFKYVQKGFYLENRDPKQTEFYKPICESLDIDYNDFKTKFESDVYRQKTIQHFERSAQMGVRSFPTIALEHENKLHLISSGYSTFESMKGRINEVLGI